MGVNSYSLFCASRRKPGSTGQLTMPFVYMLGASRTEPCTSAALPIFCDGVWEREAKAIPGFATKHGVDRLVWFEIHESLAAAAQRERRIKEWKRAWKIQLIEKDNPHWIDLYPGLSP